MAEVGAEMTCSRALPCATEGRACEWFCLVMQHGVVVDHAAFVAACLHMQV